ncbi:MAG TPA: CoA pyrophosphatase [bacterium]|nr:CoA pyrophosphatase [bacterium]
MTGASDLPEQTQRLLTDPEALRVHIQRVLAVRLPRTRPLPAGARKAAVLLPLVQSPGGAALLLTQRTETVEQHKGQISFPGGGLEDGESPLDGALRETREEIGISPADVEVLGELDDEETVVSGFLVTPIVGLVPYPSRLRLSPEEVRAVLQVPLSVLLDPQNVRTEVWERQGERSLMYFYAAGREVIWGATARIIARFLNVVFGTSLRTTGGAP